MYQDLPGRKDLPAAVWCYPA